VFTGIIDRSLDITAALAPDDEVGSTIEPRIPKSPSLIKPSITRLEHPTHY
jgi:hypothetical protein